jgi:hypothetical protein
LLTPSAEAKKWMIIQPRKALKSERYTPQKESRIYQQDV